jgi:hypothetical protein
LGADPPGADAIGAAGAWDWIEAELRRAQA